MNQKETEDLIRSMVALTAMQAIREIHPIATIMGLDQKQWREAVIIALRTNADVLEKMQGDERNWTFEKVDEAMKESVAFHEQDAKRNG